MSFTLSPARFQLIANLRRSRGRPRKAARAVLVSGQPLDDRTAKRHSMTLAGLRRTIAGFRRIDVQIASRIHLGWPDKYDLLARLRRSRGKSRKAVRRVLVDGWRNVDAARRYGVEAQTVNEVVLRFRNTEKRMKQIYNE